MLIGFIQQDAPEKLNQFYANVTDHVVALDLEMGFVMAFYVGQCVGADYFNLDFEGETTGDSMYLDSSADCAALFPNWNSPVNCSYQDQDAEEWI